MSSIEATSTTSSLRSVQVRARSRFALAVWVVRHSGERPFVVISGGRAYSFASLTRCAARSLRSLGIGVASTLRVVDTRATARFACTRDWGYAVTTGLGDTYKPASRCVYFVALDAGFRCSAFYVKEWCFVHCPPTLFHRLSTGLLWVDGGRGFSSRHHLIAEPREHRCAALLTYWGRTPFLVTVRIPGLLSLYPGSSAWLPCVSRHEGLVELLV